MRAAASSRGWRERKRGRKHEGGLHPSSGFCRGTHIVSGRPSNETNQCLPAVWRPTSWPGPVRPVKSSPHGPPAFCRPVFYILCPQVMGCYQVSGFVAWPPGLFLLRWLNRSSLPRTQGGEGVAWMPTQQFRNQDHPCQTGGSCHLVPRGLDPPRCSCSDICTH